MLPRAQPSIRHLSVGPPLRQWRAESPVTPRHARDSETFRPSGGRVGGHRVDGSDGIGKVNTPFTRGRGRFSPGVASRTTLPPWALRSGAPQWPYPGRRAPFAGGGKAVGVRPEIASQGRGCTKTVSFPGPRPVPRRRADRQHRPGGSNQVTTAGTAGELRTAATARGFDPVTAGPGRADRHRRRVQGRAGAGPRPPASPGGSTR